MSLHACPFRRECAGSVVTNGDAHRHQSRRERRHRGLAAACRRHAELAAHPAEELQVLEGFLLGQDDGHEGRLPDRQGHRGVVKHNEILLLVRAARARRASRRTVAASCDGDGPVVLCRRCRWLPLLPVPAAFPVPIASSHSRCLCFRLRPPRRHANRPCLAHLPRSSRAARTASRGRSCPS